MLLLILIGILGSSLVNSADLNKDAFIQFSPNIKLGKYENGNYFLDFVPAKVYWKVNDKVSFYGEASVGFTAPRSGRFFNMNHYTNRLTFKTTYRPYGDLGFFVEANFSNIIPGSSDDVTYFRTGNYQAIGVEITSINFYRSN